MRDPALTGAGAAAIVGPMFEEREACRMSMRMRGDMSAGGLRTLRA
jgi:hypothetical protein